MDDRYNGQDGQNPQENTYRRPTVQEQLQSSSYQQGAYQQGSYQQAAGQSQYQGSYQQPTVQEQLQYQYPSNQELEEPMTMGEWMISLLIMMIPCANIIMAFVWAFSDKEKKSKSNYFKAELIFMAIRFVLMILFFTIMGASIASLMESVTYY